MGEITPIKQDSLSPFSVTESSTGGKNRCNSISLIHDVQSPVESAEKKRFSLERANLSDNFLDELEKDMFVESEDIERQITELRGLRARNLKVLKERVFQEDNLKFSSLNFSYAPAQEGVNLLTRLFPDSILEELALSPLEKNQLARLAVNFLHAISTQSKTAEFLFKERLIKESIILKEKLVAKLKNEMKNAPSSFLSEEANLLETNIKHETNKLKLERKHYAKMKSRHYLTTRCISSLTDIFNTLIVGPLDFIFNLTWITKSFNVLAVGLSLKKIRTENQSLSLWRKNYTNWIFKYQPELKPDKKGELKLNPRLAMAEKTVKEPYESLDKLIRNHNVPYILDQLADSGLKLPSRIKTKEDLIYYLDTQPLMTQHYNQFLNKMNSLNTIIATSGNLLVKREAIRKRNIHLLEGRFDEIKEKIKAFKKGEFERIENKPVDLTFEVWFDNQDKTILIENYIDHHQTIEHAVKNGLKEMIEKKYELEAVFQKLRSIESHTIFFMTSALLTASTTFFILGMLLTPVGGIGLLFLGFSAVSALMTVGFMTAGRIYAKKYRPATSEVLTLSFQTRLRITNLRKSIANYFHNAKKRKLAETAKALYTLHPHPLLESSTPEEALKEPEGIKALEKYKKAKKAYEESLDNVNYWEKSLNAFEAELEKAGAKDVVRFALPGYMASDGLLLDPLKELQEAIKKLNFALLSPDTKALFEEQLGVSLEILENQMKANGDNFKATWEKFFTLKEDSLFDFIIIQRERIKKGGYLNPILNEEK